MSKIDIVITSFNGRELLKKQLPIVISASPQINQIIVVDDASSDDTVDFLKKHYPQIKCIHNASNQGFTKSTNIGVSHSQADYVVLLNNDVYPQENYLESPLAILKNQQVFAVTFNEIHSSWPVVTWRGKVSFIQGSDKTTTRLSLWASGGSSIVRRSTWQILGGMNPIYSPGYWEDIDLGWRSWKAGYKIVWDPQAKVEHIHESTFGKLNPKYISLVKQRNELLFNWQNISDVHLVLSHIKFLVIHTLKHPGYLKVIINALQKIPQTKSLSLRKVPDQDVLKSVNQPYNE